MTRARLAVSPVPHRSRRHAHDEKQIPTPSGWGLLSLGLFAVLAVGCGGDPVWTVETTFMRIGASAIDRLDLTMRTRDRDTAFPARMATTYEGGAITTSVNPSGELVVSIDGARVQAGLRTEGEALVYDEVFHGGDGEDGLVVMTAAVLRDGTLPITTSPETYAKFPPQDEDVFRIIIQCSLATDCSM